MPFLPVLREKRHLCWVRISRISRSPMMCIDENCKIIKGRKLQGITSFAGFKDFDDLNGIVLTDITEDFCTNTNFDKQTKMAILSAVEEYKEYTRQQEEKMCLETPK